MGPYLRAMVAWYWMDSESMEAALCDAQDDLFDAMEHWYAVLEQRS